MKYSEGNQPFQNYKKPIIAILLAISFIIILDIFFHLMGKSSMWEHLKGWGLIFFAAFLYFLLAKNKYQKKIVEEEKEKLSALINAMSDFIVLKDEHGKWVQLNEFGYKLYSLKKEDYTGKSDYELAELYEEYKDHFIYCGDTDEQAWDSKKPIQFEEILELENGERIFNVIKVPIFDKEGNRKALFVIGRDITEIKQAEELLLRNEKLSVVGQLAAGIVHEIRNPLTSLKGFVQLLQEKNGGQQFYYDIMVSELDRINHILHELLLIAKPQKITYELKNVKEMLLDVTTLMATEANLSAIRIVFEHSDDIPLLLCEEYQLKQVFINIIKNAIEASKKGDTIKIYLTTESTDVVKVDIIDEGCGISKERLSKIGEPFFTMKEKGTGLGMTVTYKLVEAHHGTIQIASEVGKGTTVTILLPIDRNKSLNQRRG